MINMPTVNEVKQIFATLANNNPNPNTELKYQNTYQLLVAVVLSAQASDASVNKSTKNLFEFIKTPKQMVMLTEQQLISHIKSIGLFNTKAKNILALSQSLIDHHSGQVPNNLNDLINLPGVGRKTANVILNIAFQQSTIAVDTHVSRVAQRLGLSKANNVIYIEKDLLKIIPKEYIYNAHHWLILHGRYICRSRKPKCHICPINVVCHSSIKPVNMPNAC